MGVVARDHVGNVLAALSTPKKGNQHPVVAEFFALWRAMQLCQEIGMERVLFEGDAQLLINNINEEEECRN